MRCGRKRETVPQRWGTGGVSSFFVDHEHKGRNGNSGYTAAGGQAGCYTKVGWNSPPAKLKMSAH